MRGGARKGAGRPATGRNKVREAFSLDIGILSELQLLIPSGKRSAFVEAAISKALDKLSHWKPDYADS